MCDMKKCACRGLSVLSVLGILLSSHIWSQEAMTIKEEETTTPHLVVLSNENDPYYPLGQEIAKTEEALLIESVEDLYDISSRYVLYVASPNNITAQTLLQFSRFFKESGKYPALGIVTGSSIEQARRLWQRKVLAKGERRFIATDANKAVGLETGIIFDASSRPFHNITLNKDHIIDALQQADYFYWARHVTYTKWFWDQQNPSNDVSLRVQDLPQLPPVVIHTPSCNSFLPSQKDNIALGFVERGAAAYIGHLYTPAPFSGIFIGHLHDLPGRYTWDQFPIGIMTQVQNRMALRAASHLPYLFMLGDPRIALTQEQPYTVDSDQVYGDKRVIQGHTQHTGVLPVYIEEGAAYSFVRIKGLSSVSDRDLFYNGQIQTLNLQADKYLFFLHNGGHFHIEISKTPPFLWAIVDSLHDAFEYSWVVRGVTQGTISFGFLAIFLGIFLVKISRKRSVKAYIPSIVFGIVVALAQAIFIVYHGKSVTVSSYSVTYSPSQLLLGFLGTFSTVSGGMMIIADAQKFLLKMLGMCLCVLPQFLLTGFYFLVVSVTNLLYWHHQRMIVWNGMPVVLPSIVLILEVVIFSSFYLKMTRHHR